MKLCTKRCHISRGITLVMMPNSMDAIMDENKKALENHFDRSFLADKIKAYKPHIEFFKYVHDELDFDKNNHTHIANGWKYKMNWKYKIWVNRNRIMKSPEFDPQIEVLYLNETLNYLPPIKSEDL